MYKEVTETRQGFRIKCIRKTCGHEWNYFGNAEKYVCCPKCRTSVTLFPKRVRRK